MRKALLFFAVLLVLVGSCAGVAIANAAAAQNTVTLAPAVSYGDAAALAGLQLESRVKLNGYQFWHTTLTPDGSAETETVFRHYPNRQQDAFPRSGDGYFYLFDYARMGMSSNGAIDLDDPYGEDHYRGMESIETTLAGLKPLILDVAANTPAGTSHTETLSLADYMDYYPLALDLQLHDYSTVAPLSGKAHMMQQLRQAFPIPVDKNDRPEITVTKNAAGEIVGIDIGNQAAGQTDTFYTVSLIYDKEIPEPGLTKKGYYLFALCGQAAKDADFPGGYGIYRLPWWKMARQVGYKNSEVVYDAQLIPGQLELLTPLDKTEDLLHMAEFNGQILLVTRSGQRCTLKTLDMETGTLLHTLPLPQSLQGMEQNHEVYTVLPQQGFVLILFSDGQFALVESDSDGLRLGLVGNYHDTEIHGVQLFYSFNDTALAWDGRRLAIAGYNNQWYEPGACDIHLAVFDADGVAWAGTWQNSLGRNEGYTSSDKCTMPTNNAPVALHWVE